MNAINCPTSWNDVSISMFRELASLSPDLTTSQRVIQTVSILTDTDPELVKKLPIHVISQIASELKFMDDMPIDDFAKEFEADGTVYRFTEPSKMTVGEWVDIEEYLKDINNNMHKILAIIYRETPEYFGYKEERAKVMDAQSVTRIYGAMVFFSVFGAELYRSSKGYSQEQMKDWTKTALKLAQSDGGGMESSIDSLVEILPSLKKSAESISSVR
jgi:hypothetical protein